MSDFEFFASKSNLSQKERYYIRRLSGLSDDEVKERAARDEMLFAMELEFPFFGHEYKESKEHLLFVLEGIECGELALKTFFRSNLVESKSKFLERIEQCKEEMLQQDVCNQLEDGDIENEEQYEIPEGFD